jgi:hypothetical protein
LLQRLLAGNKCHLTGLNLSNAAPNLLDLRSLDLGRNVVGERLDEAISEFGALRRGKLLYLGKYLGNGLRHGKSIFAAFARASV